MSKTITCKGRPIVARPGGETLQFAASELTRYLYLLSDGANPHLAQLPEEGGVILLTVEPDLAREGYRLCIRPRGSELDLLIAGGSEVGVLYGVYRLLEEWGMGFYNGGDCFPNRPIAADLPCDLHIAEEPAFAVRGNMLHYNFLNGPTCWGLDDYRFYFDQLARQRMNLLLMHWYDSEPGAAYELDGAYRAGGRTPNSLAKPWGALEALRTSEFYFDTGRCFDAEIWSSPAGENLPDVVTEIKRSEQMFDQATRYAMLRGIRVAAGFEAPPGHQSPTEPAVRRAFLARLEQFVARYPMLTYLALWQHESGGCFGTPPPPPGSDAARLLESQRETFAYLGNDQRIWEAIRFGEFARLAADFLAEHAAHLRLVIVGWGGDRWMRFADLCLAYDKLLPASVIFTCHENIDATLCDHVSTPWGELPPERERWAMPWVEGDMEDCWVRQPNVAALGKLAPDALAKGCQGLLNLQWRTRDIEEENAYTARFAWNPSLTPDDFYRDYARRSFGPHAADTMAEIIRTLQELGAHWTGVHGTFECSKMIWTGWEPPFPTELDAEAVRFLAPLAEKAAAALSQQPAEAGQGEGAFHLQKDLHQQVTLDESRPGVQEMLAIAQRFRELAELPEQALREALWALHEEAFALRTRLVRAGMTSPGYRAVDCLLFALHFLLCRVGYKRHSAMLRDIRSQLAEVRQQLMEAGQGDRIERLDFLDATIEFVLAYDEVATRLATGQRFDQVVAQAEQMEEAAAVPLIAELYDELVNAGMQEALLAYTRRLTVRGDWGTLTTLNIKPMPAYWQAIAQLESCLPAAPPRELKARGQASEVWLSWQPPPKGDTCHLYRQGSDTHDWQRLTTEPIAADCCGYVDRPPGGTWRYAVTALTADGFESPRSHPVSVTCGAATMPRILACKPFSQLAAGEPYLLRVVVLSDLELQGVWLHVRALPDGDWRQLPMHQRFRESWFGVIPPLSAGALMFYIRAVDIQGQAAVWPPNGPDLPWSLTICAPTAPKGALS